MSMNEIIDVEYTAQNRGMQQQIKTQYCTALSVQKPRELAKVESRCIQEADLAGESFFYGWGAGKDRIEGPSIDCAMSLIRCYGNCVVEMQPVIETHDAWLFTAAFVDLETGFTLNRQFRQSKKHVVHGKHDEFRKEDIRFQIGQSKAIRNVVLNALPKWLTSKMVERAKNGVRAAIEKQLGQSGLEAVVKAASAKLERAGVDQRRLLAKFSRSTLLGLTLEDLVVIKADLSAIESGQDVVDNLYPLAEESDQQTVSAATQSEHVAAAVAAARARQAAAKPPDAPKDPDGFREAVEAAKPDERPATPEPKPAQRQAKLIAPTLQDVAEAKAMRRLTALGKDAQEAVASGLITEDVFNQINDAIAVRQNALAEAGAP